VLRYLTKTLEVTETQKTDWYRHWLHEGLQAIERLLTDSGLSGTFCHGNEASMADCCLIPQVFNAQRFQCPLTDFPNIQRIVAFCETMESFQAASPERQLDAEPAR
jgi:maleylacetoacetate isomerase/maleylpyruvate isomerase